MEIREIGPGETRLAAPALHVLRPGFADEAAIVRAIDGTQRGEGYRLAGAFEGGREHALAVAGFRLAHSLAWGRHLYVDDLSTLPEARRRGHAHALLAWVLDEARRLGCEQLHLDSGVGLDRAPAHRLYLNSGLAIASHHFARGVPR